MPGQFYRAPIDPGYGRMGALAAEGVRSGIMLAAAGGDRRRQERLAQEERARAEAERRRREDLELGPVLDEDEAYELVGGGAPAVPVPGVATERANRLEGLIPAGERAPGGMRVEGPPAMMEAAASGGSAPQRRLRAGVARVGGEYRNIGQSVPVMRAAAAGRMEREQESMDRSAKYEDTYQAAIRAGKTPELARDLAMHSAYGAPIRRSPEELRAEEEVRDEYRARDDERTTERSLALIAARGDGGGAGAARAERNGARRDAREAAERFFRENPRAHVNDARNYLNDRGRGYRDTLSREDVNNIVSAAEASVRGKRSQQGRPARTGNGDSASAGRAGSTSGARRPTRPAAQRAQELADQDKTPEEIVRIMRSEGYQ